MKKLSVILLGTLFCICFALLPMETQAAETEGYLTYTIKDGQVTITDCDEDASGKIEIPDTIKGYPVTKIGEGAFWDCTGIKEIVVPNSITVIPNAAFRECETLEKITLPEGITSIGNGAFYECEYLESINIPKGVTSIGGGAFLACYKLSEFTIPEGVQEIQDSTFAYCNSLTDVTIPETVTSIGAEAFAGCPLSSDFVLPKQISSIGDGAFSRGCGITIPKDHPYFTVDEYGVLFSRDKTKLVYALSPIEGKYEVPAGVQTVQGMAFRGLSKLTEIVFPDSLMEIGSYALSATGLTKFRIPEGLTTVESYLLYGCQKLESVYIPDSVTHINEYAFANSMLDEVRFSDNLQYIGDWAFLYCHMEKIYFPESLQEIGRGAFAGCTSLREVVHCSSTEQWWDTVIIGEQNDSLQNGNRYCHSWSLDIIRRESTCTELGEAFRYCKYCGEERSNTMPLLAPHSMGEKLYSDENSHWRECTACNKRGFESVHSPGPDATHTAPQTCTACGYELAPKLERNFTWLWVGIGLAAVVGVGITAGILIKKKRK